MTGSKWSSASGSNSCPTTATSAPLFSYFPTSRTMEISRRGLETDHAAPNERPILAHHTCDCDQDARVRVLDERNESTLFLAVSLKVHYLKIWTGKRLTQVLHGIPSLIGIILNGVHASRRWVPGVHRPAVPLRRCPHRAKSGLLCRGPCSSRNQARRHADGGGDAPFC